jgi:hypothetical protein
VDLAQLITAAPNLAFGIIALWFVREIQKERVAEGARYATSLEKINELYIVLLKEAVTAIANNTSLSAGNRDALAKLSADLAAIRLEIGGRLDGMERVIRDGAKRNQSDRPGSQSRPGAD